MAQNKCDTLPSVEWNLFSFDLIFVSFFEFSGIMLDSVVIQTHHVFSEQPESRRDSSVDEPFDVTDIGRCTGFKVNELVRNFFNNLIFLGLQLFDKLAFIG